MKISEVNSHLVSFEKFLHQHINPNNANNHHFQTMHHKTYSISTILKNLESLAKSMEKKGLGLNRADRVIIHEVLDHVTQITAKKLQRKAAFPTKHDSDFLRERLSQVQKLDAKLGTDDTDFSSW